MQIKKGEVIEGKITGITKYGAFVNIDGETNGMIHISEISPDFITDINEFLKINQTVKAVVIGVNENGKLSLSIKQLNKIDKIDKSDKNEADAKPGKPRIINYRRLEKPEEFVKTDKNAGGSRSFEDMMNKFKRDSDEKISDLKFLEPKKSGVSRKKNQHGNNKQ